MSEPVYEDFELAVDVAAHGLAHVVAIGDAFGLSLCGVRAGRFAWVTGPRASDLFQCAKCADRWERDFPRRLEVEVAE